MDYLENPDRIDHLDRADLAALFVKVKSLEGRLLAGLLAGDAQPTEGPTAASPPTATPVSAWLTRRQLALRLQISVATLDRWIDAGKFPKPKYHGEHSPRWSAVVVEEWERKGR